MKSLLIKLLLLLPLLSQAEIYQNILPTDTLGEIKSKFPNANFVKRSPAWAQSTDAMYAITGKGISGTIIINFFDNRPEYQKGYENAVEDAQKQLFEKLLNESEDEAISVNWVRWIPDVPFPLQRLIAKYGNPEKKGFSDDDFQPYREWKKIGLLVYLSDDEKNVQRIDFSFTKEEYKKAYKKKYNILPDWLK